MLASRLRPFTLDDEGYTGNDAERWIDFPFPV
jgi:hypothetical protein